MNTVERPAGAACSPFERSNILRNRIDGLQRWAPHGAGERSTALHAS
jgi:hypothetical protein